MAYGDIGSVLWFGMACGTGASRVATGMAIGMTGSTESAKPSVSFGRADPAVSSGVELSNGVGVSDGDEASRVKGAIGAGLPAGYVSAVSGGVSGAVSSVSPADDWLLESGGFAGFTGTATLVSGG